MFQTIPVKRIANGDEIEVHDYLYHDVRVMTKDGCEISGDVVTIDCYLEIGTDEDEMGIEIPSGQIIGLAASDILYIEALDSAII